jgi:hypothetical protein
MARTVPGRRVVVAADDMVDAERRRLAEDQRLPIPVTEEDMQKPQTYAGDDLKTLTYEQRLQRQIDMLNGQMTKYERVVMGGGELDGESEKRLMQLVDSARKLELALSQIRAKDSGLDSHTDLELALQMVEKGIPYDTVIQNFNHNKQLAADLKEALTDAE